MIRLVILMSVALLSAAEDRDVITVPRDVLKFIIGCNQGDLTGRYSVPVHKTQISDIDGTTSQHVSLLSLEELRDALKQSVHNEDVLGHIIQQVEDAAKTDKLSIGRSDECTVENNISIAVPPQELDDFNDRVQMLMQQNSRLLLEQINNLFTYKFVRQKVDAEKLLKRRTNQILQKLNKIMTHLGIPMETNEEGEDEDEDDDFTTTPVYPVVDFDTTWHPEAVEPEMVPEQQGEPEPKPESEPEPEPESEPEPLTTVRPPPSTFPEPANEAVTELFQPVSVTELLQQPMTTNKPASSEEDGDDDDDDKRRLSGSSSSSSSSSSSGVGMQGDGFIRTPQQQPPVVFNSGIGLIPSISRRDPIRDKTRFPSKTRFRPIPA